jgi:hypothetical protein
MPQPLNLFKAFEKGEIVDLQFTQDQHQGPPSRKRWLLLNGMISHDDSGATHIFQKKIQEALTLYNNPWEMSIAATTPVSGHYPLWSTLSTAGQSQMSLVILDDDEEFWIHGGTAIVVRLRVLEWTP